ncbi:hypothetical protein OAU52_01375, partial [bacterium]|nr:hypothetical protein [bacterium]
MGTLTGAEYYINDADQISVIKPVSDVEKFQSQEYSNYYGETGYQPFFNLNIGYEYSINDYLQTRTGLGYQRMGNSINQSNGVLNESTQSFDYIERVSTDILHDYLNINLELKAFLPIGLGGVYTTVGAKPGYLVSASIIDNHNSQEADRPNTSSFNFAIGFRIGSEFTAWGHTLYVESGYDQGLNTSYSNEGGAEQNTEFIQALNIGYKHSL